MTEDQADRLERLEALLLDLAPTINALGSVLVRQSNATERMGLSKNTLAQNKKLEKFEGIGELKTLITVSDLAVVKRRKGTQKRFR